MKKQLTRSTKNRMIFGVCGGLGEYGGVDPTIVRIAYVALTLFTAVALGIILYIIAAVIMPER